MPILYFDPPICGYGCGREAKYPPRKGMTRWCCREFFTKCPYTRSMSTLKNTGKKQSEETKAKKSKIQTGKKHTKETKDKISKSKKGIKLGPFSEDHKNKISLALMGHKPTFTKHSIKSRLKISLSQKGVSKPSRPHSDETRRKIRISHIRRIEMGLKDSQKFEPNYNPDACKLIDEYGKKHGYNFQHGMNGGEFKIEKLYYWVDGYDIEKNIVIEVDELGHFDKNGNLCEKDIRRQNEIMEYLKCPKFIRINYTTGEVKEYTNQL